MYIIYNKIITQAMICSGCKKHYDSQYNTKTNCYYKTCVDCRNKNNVRKKQASTATQNNEDNISTKSSTQHSQFSISNKFEIIANNNQTTQFIIFLTIQMNIENLQQMKD